MAGLHEESETSVSAEAFQSNAHCGRTIASTLLLHYYASSALPSRALPVSKKTQRVDK